MDVQTLIEKRTNLWDEARKFLDEHTDANGLISAEDEATYEKMERDIDALGKQIERYEKRKEMDDYLATPATKPLLSNPQSNGGKVGRASDQYKAAMIRALRTNFRQVSNLLEETQAAQGGFLVPTEWDERLISVLEEENVMRALGTRITTFGEHKINIVASKPAAAWISEGQPLTFGNATFAQKTLDAYKLGVGIQITNELLQDNAFDLENYIIEQFGKALANAEEDAFINGNGTNQPTGFLTTIAADATAFTTTTGTNLSPDDIINLEYSLKRPYRKNAAFIVNDSTIALLRKFKDSTQNYLWQPSYVASEPPRLFGQPVYTSAFMPPPSTGNVVVIYGDFDYFTIADRGQRAFKPLRELYALQDSTGFLMVQRVDSAITNLEAFKALKLK